jgi:hypothetical protein
MKKELDYFYIGEAYGGSQDWFSGLWMRMGGCAAETACDSSVYFALYKGKTKLYPFDVHNLTRKDYVAFSKIMRPYLRPRFSGIDRLEIYVEGFGRYLRDHGEDKLQLLPWEGEQELAPTQDIIKKQIAQDFPVPCLILNHKNKALEDYVWHWFLLTGYEEAKEKFMVKAVTYGSWKWLDLAELWDTGNKRKGGLILFKE